jgi:hypothetical protein
MVYFIEAGNTGLIKIGHTEGTVERRIAELQPGCPFALRVVGTMDGGRDTERDLHLMFEDRRARGEWFMADDNMRDVLARLAGGVGNG